MGRSCTRGGRVAFDIETTALNCMTCDLVGFSLADSRCSRVMCLSGIARRAVGSISEMEQALHRRRSVKRSLRETPARDPSVLKIGQNIKFDLLVMKRYGVNVAPIDDTMLISYVLDAGRGGHGMDDLAERPPRAYVHSLRQGERARAGREESEKTFAEVPVERRPSMRLKTRTTRCALDGAEAAASRRKTRNVYETLERPLVPVIVGMEHHGILVDRSVLSRLSSTFAQALCALSKRKSMGLWVTSSISAHRSSWVNCCSTG